MPTTQSGVADQFVNDVRTAVEEIMKTPSKDCEGVVSSCCLSIWCEIVCVCVYGVGGKVNVG